MSGFPSYPYWGTNERFAMNMTRGVEKFDEPFVGILDVRKKNMPRYQLCAVPSPVTVAGKGYGSDATEASPGYEPIS